MISSKRLAIFASTLVLATLAACGGSDGPTESDVVTPTYQKNAALSFTTLPATTLPRTVTTPMPAIGGATPRPSTTVAKATTTSIAKATTTVVKTVTTPVPKLPVRK